jgi:NAD dependent epimerase/dehydratase
MGRKVLVTGAGGFIASHLVERLVARGESVRALVHYNSANVWFHLDRLPKDCLREIEIVPGDVTDAELVSNAVRGCDVVFHLAALIGIPYSYQAVRSYVQVNTIGTLNVLQACLQAGVSRLVHTSTSEVYGSAQYVPIDEAHPLVAQSPYAATKIAADKLVESYVNSFSLPACIVRPFNTYGPRQSARAVIPTIISQALAGSEVQLGSTTPVRDLTYVTDTADGFIAASSAPCIGETMNLGTGDSVSIGDLVVEIGRRLGRTLEVRTDERRVRPEASEVERLISQNEKAHRLLGWQPTVPLAEGLDRTIQYISDNAADFRSHDYVR